MQKKGTVLLSTSLAWPAVAGCSQAETFSQLSSISFAQPCRLNKPAAVLVLILMNQPTQRECDYTPSNRAEFGIKSGVVGRAAKGFLMEQTGNTGSKSYLTPGARVTDPGKGEAFLRRQSELLEQGGSSPPELSREGNGLSGSCKSLTDMWEVQLNRPAVVNHTGSAFQASGQNMAERRRSLWAQFSQEKKEPSFRSWDGDGEDGVIQAGTVGNARGLLESSHAEVAKPFVPPPAGEAHGTARNKFQAALQGHSGGGIPKRGPVQRSKSCTSMQPLWDNLLNNDATPREGPKFIGGGAAVGLGQARKSYFSFEFEFPANYSGK